VRFSFVRKCRRKTSLGPSGEQAWNPLQIVQLHDRSYQVHRRRITQIISLKGASYVVAMPPFHAKLLLGVYLVSHIRPEQAVLTSKHAFLHLVDPAFACAKESDNMCTLTCSSGFFASDKGRGIQLNVKLVCDLLMFYTEGNRSTPVFSLPLLHAESVLQEVPADHPLSSCVVVLESQFRQCVVALSSSHLYLVRFSLSGHVPHRFRLSVCRKPMAQKTE
jgi:hypothetical protein